MNRQELEKILTPYANGGAVITRAQLAKAMGIKNPKNVDRHLAGLEKIDGKYYLIRDVANNLLSKVS